MTKPNRAKMCNWVASQLANIQTRPSNPADIATVMRLSVEAERDIRDLRFIVAEMGWHADADLTYATELMQEYDARKAQERTERHKIDLTGSVQGQRAPMYGSSDEDGI